MCHPRGADSTLRNFLSRLFLFSASISYLCSSPFCFRFMNERILLRKIRTRRILSFALVSPRVHILLSPVFQSLSAPFFILVDATFALVHHAPGDFFSPFIFFALPQSQCGGIFVLFYFCRPSSSFFLLVRRLRRSLSASFAPPLPLLYLFPGVLPAFPV